MKRKYTKLSDLTDEELKAHKRKQQREYRQRRIERLGFEEVRRIERTYVKDKLSKRDKQSILKRIAYLKKKLQGG